MQRPYRKIFITICIIFILIILSNFLLTIPYYKLDSVEFQNLDRLQLSARYSQSENGEGVLIATDITHDKSELAGLVYEFTKAGYGVYVFDFPSQGTSGGNLPFHINTGSYMAEQFYCAAVSYSQLANIAVENIHVVAYGQGARAVLQTVSLGFLSPKSITLVGCDLNLTDKIQYDFLNYSVDKELSWVQAINSATGGCSYHIVSSGADNVSTTEDNNMLVNMLSDTTYISGSNTVTHTDVNGVIHSRLMHSNKVAESIVDGISGISNVSYDYAGITGIKSLLQILIYVCVIAGSYTYYLAVSSGKKEQTTASNPKLGAFIRSKLMFWIPNLIAVCLLPLVLYIIPISYPYNDILKFTIFASYGLLMLVIYKFTNFNNGIGKSFFRSEKDASKYKGFIVGAAYVIIFSIISFSGTFSIFAVKSRWPWMIIFTVIGAVMFYIDEKERKLYCRNAKDTVKLICINYLGCILLPVLMLVLGLTDSLFEILMMIIFLLLLYIIEKILNAFKSATGINAIVKAFLFQLIILAQGAMWMK